MNDDLLFMLVYLGPAIVLALAARRSRLLRRMTGWHRFGSRPRPDGVEAAMAATLAAVGTGRAARTEGDWRVFRPSLGTRLLTPALSVALILTMQDTSLMAPVPPAMVAFILLTLVYANLAMLLYRVEIGGDVLVLRSAPWPATRFDLRQLVSVEEDAVHSFRLAFADGRSGVILKTVAGAAELRHMLQVRLEQTPGA